MAHGERPDAGFSLIELLIASAIMLTITGAVLALVNPAQGVFRAQPEASDMQQRLRVATDVLTTDLRMAGAGVTLGPTTGPLTDYFAPLLPYRTGDIGDDARAGVHFRSDTVSVLYVPAAAAVASLSEQLVTGSSAVTVAPLSNCPPPSAASLCGFAAGVRAMVFDATGAHDETTVAGVVTPTLQVQYTGALRKAYRAGAVITQVETRTYYLKAVTSQLMRYDGYRSDLPLVDNVVKVEFQYFGEPRPPALLPDVSLDDDVGPFTTYGPKPPAIGVDNPADAWPPGENCVFMVQDGHHEPRLPSLAAGAGLVALPPGLLTDGPWCVDAGDPRRFDADLLRIRRVSLTVRVQSGLAMLRGPAGVLFTRGGTATSAERFVPDLEMTLDVTPRNMSLRPAR